MNDQERLCYFYESILAQEARQIAQQLVESWVRQLQRQKRNSNMLHSPEDSGLENLWDEICVQVQGEHSLFWELEQEYLYQLIYHQLEKRCTQNQLRILWLQTSPFEDFFEEWCREQEDAQRNNPGQHFGPAFPQSYCLEDVAQWCLDQLLTAAVNYENKRINEYLAQ